MATLNNTTVLAQCFATRMAFGLAWSSRERDSGLKRHVGKNEKRRVVTVALIIDKPPLFEIFLGSFDNGTHAAYWVLSVLDRWTYLMEVVFALRERKLRKKPLAPHSYLSPWDHCYSWRGWYFDFSAFLYFNDHSMGDHTKNPFSGAVFLRRSLIMIGGHYMQLMQWVQKINDNRAGVSVAKVFISHTLCALPISVHQFKHKCNKTDIIADC